MKKVTEQFHDDVEAWIELAEILVQSDLHASLAANLTATKIFQENVDLPIPPEILNNMGSLHYLLGNMDEARDHFERAFDRANEEEAAVEDDKTYYKEISYTIRYNLARVFEGICQLDKAERLYKDILLECPSYIDCYLRLGCMLRDRGQIYEASDKFKDALQFSNEHPDAWSLIGKIKESTHFLRLTRVR